ncbi:MAG: HAMP domain-containing histidine kinase [Lachnospiraceae bacterium]|nr:HAMP domain-containing histidine kinase [Lachnospiraceae bacterium]
MRKKLSFENIRLFVLEVLILFVVVVFLMMKQAEIYGVNLLKDSERYTVWYLLYWWVVVVVAVSLITVLRYFFIDRPIRELSIASRKVAAGNFSVRLKSYPLSSKQGYINIMYRDFNTMVEELASIEMLKTDFVSNVSHEIKTPLAVIQNYIALLQNESTVSSRHIALLQNESTVSSRQREYADIIMQATQQLTSLVTNILRLSKLESQFIVSEAKPYDICRQLSDCVMAFADRLEEKGIEFEADMEDRAVITADESIMEIVWNNLLSNAIKFTERGGRITLKQKSEQEYIVVSVEDNGCGMDGATIKRIFDKFYQGDTSHSQEGYGLGLALTARIIALHNGEIQVSSEPGKGTVFCVRLRRE